MMRADYFKFNQHMIAYLEREDIIDIKHVIMGGLCNDALCNR